MGAASIFVVWRGRYLGVTRVREEGPKVSPTLFYLMHPAFAADSSSMHADRWLLTLGSLCHRCERTGSGAACTCSGLFRRFLPRNVDENHHLTQTPPATPAPPPHGTGATSNTEATSYLSQPTNKGTCPLPSCAYPDRPLGATGDTKRTAGKGRRHVRPRRRPNHSTPS